MRSYFNNCLRTGVKIAKYIALWAFMFLALSVRSTAADGDLSYNSREYGPLKSTIINGTTWRYSIKDSECIIWGCVERSGVISIPDSIEGCNVTGIGSGAFSGVADYTGDLTLPPYVKTIGSSAFSSCVGLTGKLTLPSSLATIGSRAFYGCVFEKIGNASNCNIPASDLLRILSSENGTRTDRPNNSNYYVNDETNERVDQIGTGLFTRKNKGFELTANDTKITASIGDMVQLKYKFTANSSYPNPRLYIDIQNASGETIDSKFVNFSGAPVGNTISYETKYPTTQLSAGEYKAVAYMGYNTAGEGEYTILSEERTVTTIVLTTPSDNNIEPNSDNTNADNGNQVTAFVSRMYTVALGRAAEEAGLNDWSTQLKNKTNDGAGIAKGFIESAEFTSKNYSNEQYVDILYHTFFDREPDEGGRSGWINELGNGASRRHVLAGFVNSQEFTALCDRFGITRGTLEDEGQSGNSQVNSAQVRAFVERMYTKALGRSGEEDGINEWTRRIVSSEWQAANVAKEGFFTSQEYINKNRSNEEFVEDLYQALFDRASDEAGKADWLNKLTNGVSREDVMNGFGGSQEFANMLAGFGL